MLKRVIIVTRRGEKKPIIQVGNKGSVTNKTHFPSQRKPKKSGRFVKRRKRKNPKGNMTPSITSFRPMEIKIKKLRCSVRAAICSSFCPSFDEPFNRKENVEM